MSQRGGETFFRFSLFFALPSKRKNSAPDERARNSRREYFRGRVHKRRTPTFNRSRSTCICCVTYIVLERIPLSFSDSAADTMTNDRSTGRGLLILLARRKTSSRNTYTLHYHCVLRSAKIRRFRPLFTWHLLLTGGTVEYTYTYRYIIPAHTCCTHCYVRAPEQEMTDRPATTQNPTSCYTCIRMRYVRVYDGTAVVALHNVRNVSQYQTYTIFNIYDVRYRT